MSINKIINQLKPKELFLIDIFGAWVSCFMLGLVLPSIELFKMPENILYLLAFIPCLFAIYSVAYYFNFNKKWRFYLKMIAIANLFYCLLTGSLLIYYFKTLSIFDIIYFVVEIIVIVILVMIEWKTANVTINS